MIFSFYFSVSNFREFIGILNICVNYRIKNKLKAAADAKNK